MSTARFEIVRTVADQRWIARFLDRLLGERCHACGVRVFPRNQVGHYVACSRWFR